MIYGQAVVEGLGQLEAYTEETEGVAFLMDNGMFWNSVDEDTPGSIQPAAEKAASSKFFATATRMGRVALRDCRGLYLAAMCLTLGGYQYNYPLRPLHRKPQVTSEFLVFHKGNKVAFQAYNGCFLRGGYALEASSTIADSSCLFRPLIGDLVAPDFEVVSVAVDDLSKLKCKRRVLKKEKYINRSEEPESHRFAFTWTEEVVQITVWTHQWGLGLVTTAEFEILDTKATLKYNEDNDKVVSVIKTIHETLSEEVELPPRSKATARVVVYKQESAIVSFKARIRKRRPDGSMQAFVEPGAWRGMIYHGLKLEVKVTPLGISCPTM